MGYHHGIKAFLFQVVFSSYQITRGKYSFHCKMFSFPFFLFPYSLFSLYFWHFGQCLLGVLFKEILSERLVASGLIPDPIWSPKRQWGQPRRPPALPGDLHTPSTLDPSNTHAQTPCFRLHGFIHFQSCIVFHCIYINHSFLILLCVVGHLCCSHILANVFSATLSIGGCVDPFELMFFFFGV